MANRITSTDNKLMSRALGITDRRYEEILNTVRDIMERNEGIRYSEIAAHVSSQLELSTNEIFFLGMALGGYAQFRFFVDGMIQEVEEFENIPMGVPVVKTSQMAMA